MFPRAPQSASDSIVISATAENSRELEWFIQRYPMDVSNPTELARLSADHRDMEQRIADLLANRAPPSNVDLALPPRAYQSVVADHLEVRGGLLLADDVGLGKTVSAMCSMPDPENRPVVVVCPTHLPRQWARELARFLPGLKVHVVRKGTVYPLTRQPRSRTADLWPERLPDVIVINYHKLRGWAETLCELVRYVVFDECQQLRNPGSEIYRACTVMARRARRVLGLSATPIYNYGAEFYSVLNLLVPDALGAYEEFVREWCTVGGSVDKARMREPDQFGAWLRRSGVMLRRTRAEVGRELPPLTKVVHEIDSDADVLATASGDAAALARIILAHNERYRGERLEASGKFEALVRQATGLAKAPFVADFVRMLVESGERVVLFGWHHAVYDVWSERLDALGVARYTGEESPNQKQAALGAFKAGAAKVLIMSLRAGAGVDGLQGIARTVVFGELDWSPGVHEQCVGRVHRDGQDEPCVAYFMVSDSGADPIMSDVLGVKREQIEGVRNPGQGLLERVDTGRNEIRVLAQQYLAARGEDAGTRSSDPTPIRETEVEA